VEIDLNGLTEHG